MKFRYYLFSVDSDQELTTVTFLRVEGAKNPKAEDGITQNLTATIGANSQGMSGNINEDSIDAATAILDAAAINPALDQGLVSGGDSIGVGASNPIAMLNQEQIRCEFM